MLRLGTGHKAVTFSHKPQASNMQHFIMSTYQHMHHPTGFPVSKGVSTERQRQPRHNVERLKNRNYPFHDPQTNFMDSCA